MADSIRTVVCDTITLRIVWPDRVILDVPDLMAQLVEPAEPVQIEPALAAERAPAHHSQNNESQLTIHFAGRSFCTPARSCHSRQQETRSYEGACFFFLSAELGTIKLGKISSLPHELIESSLLDDLPSAHNNNQIGLADRGEAVSNDERGATCGQLLKAFHD